MKPGTHLGPYEIVAQIGAGGMGEVYRARDTRLGRDVAIKVLPPEFADDPERLRRFEQEARAVAALSHPNILAIHDVGTHEGSPYLVTELLEGESLQERLQARPLTPRKVVEVAVQIAQGLAAAHEKGIVHRDLKPANVFITKDGHVKILDFGLAKLAQLEIPHDPHAKTVSEEPATESGAVLGTMGYTSPEQLRGERADARSDIFSFGCVLYEMLAGKSPFLKGTGAETVTAIMSEDPAPLAGTGRNIPPAIEGIVARCLEKRQEDRFSSAHDLALALRAYSGGSETPTTRSVRALRVRRSWLVGAAAVGVLAVVAALLVWAPWRRATPAASFDPKSVVVAVFVNRTGDSSIDRLGQQIADALTNDMLKTGELKVAVNPVASERRGEGGFGPAGEIGGEPLLRLAQATRSALVVAGAYYLRGDQIEVQARLVEPWQGKLVCAAAPAQVPRADPLVALEPLRQRITGAAAWSLVEMPSAPLGAIRPPRYDSLGEYRLALAAFGRDYEATTAHLARALTLDPEFDWARVMQFWACRVEDRQEEAARVLAELEGALGRMTQCERVIVRSCRADLDGNRLGALVAWREVDALAGGAPAFRYNRGMAEIHVNRPADAVRTLSGIPSDWTAPGDFAGYWPTNNLARAHHMNGDYKGQLRVAREGLRRFPDVLAFYSHEVAALAALGRLDEIEKVVQACQSVPRRQAAGTPGSVMLTAATELRAHGYREASLWMANRAVEWQRGLPLAEMKTASAREALRNALCWAERWTEAKAIAAEMAKERPENIDDLGTLATLAVRLGHSAEARRIDAQLAALTRPYLYGNHTYWRACIAAQLGEKERAVALLREAFSQGYRFVVGIHSDMDLEPLWGYPPFQELMKPKG